jgi:phosphonate transport system ATP-binding protein
VTSLHAIEFARSHYQRIIGLKAVKIFFDLPANSLTDDRIDQLYDTLF